MNRFLCEPRATIEHVLARRATRVFLLFGFACSLVALATGVALPQSEGDVSSERAAKASWPVVPHSLTEDEADYRLTIGDVVEISVRGFPDLRQRSAVELNGEVSLPLAGRIRVNGMTIAEAQASIKRLVTARPLGQRSPDGRENFTVIAADDVNVAVAEYRPVYVLGDVGKPGELPFRPGLTARQAIALAGGFDIMRYRLVNPFTESADMKGQHDMLWTELASVRAHIGRLQAEMDGRTVLTRAAFVGIPLDAEFIDRVYETASETLKRRTEDLEKEREHLAFSVHQAKQKVESIASILRVEEDGFKEDKREYAELVEYNKRGTVSLARIMELRRVQSTSSARVLQTRILLDQAKRELSEAQRGLDRFEHTRRTELLKELQEANVGARTLQARLSANNEKLVHTSLLKSRLVRGPGAKATISVYRSSRNTRKMIEGEEDTLLLPGDTVEIALRNEFDVEKDGAPVPVHNARAPH